MNRQKCFIKTKQIQDVRKVHTYKQNLQNYAGNTLTMKAQDKHFFVQVDQDQTLHDNISIVDAFDLIWTSKKVSKGEPTQFFIQNGYFVESSHI